MLACVSDGFPSAADLRVQIAILEANRYDRRQARKQEKEAAARKAAWDFMIAKWRSADHEALLDKVFIATGLGRFSVPVMRFPAKLCTDHGRAVNNELDGWEATLPGKAADFYCVWRDTLKPQGYRLHAWVVDFPDGMPGDVGLFLDWTASH
ncbi:MAG: hypothetical protein AAGF71_13355 [Pseudomonadota bacterium]